jgi:hypothetical protein
LIYEDDPVFGPLLHRPSGTGGHAPGIFTMKAGHENIGYAGQVVNAFWSNRYDLAEPGA